jgi:SAM-dependent methyltransferase
MAAVGLAPLTQQISDRLRLIRRRLLAHRYLSGTGIEIGALHQPLNVPRSARVRYVDRVEVEELRAQYPELGGYDLVAPDVIDDAETLETVPDRTQDFVIANHLLEHTENPLLALTNMLRVLRPGGVVYLGVPDKRFTFDVDRETTPLEHVVDDFENGSEGSRRGHFEEWVRLVDKAPEAEVEVQVAALLARHYSIHFHVWTYEDVLELLGELLSHTADVFEIVAAKRNGHENIFVLRKAA